MISRQTFLKINDFYKVLRYIQSITEMHPVNRNQFKKLYFVKSLVAAVETSGGPLASSVGIGTILKIRLS